MRTYWCDRCQKEVDGRVEIMTENCDGSLFGYPYYALGCLCPECFKGLQIWMGLEPWDKEW